jgi:hypothetical protein
MNRDSSSPVYPSSEDGLLNESTTKDGQLIAHLNYLGGREKQKFDHLRETKDLAVAWPPETGLRIKIRRQYKHCTGGVWPANFERLRETKDLST